MGRLIGRQRELRDIERHLLGRENLRLLTLTGPPGVGKSRLAAEVARHLFRSARRHVAVGTLGEDHGLPHVVRRRPDGQQVVLVLDDLDDQPAAATQLADLLATSPDLAVLLARRCPLHLHSERVYPIAPLTLPDSAAPTTPEALMHSDAVRLYVTRASAADPEFRLDTGDAEAVARLCRWLDGLPLAIELAAARVRAFPPAALLEQLERGRVPLAWPSPDRPVRHRSLRAAVTWSYERLEAVDRLLLDRLSVFVGSFTLEAVERACGGSAAADDFIERLPRLVDTGLVQPIAVRGGQARFRLLEPIRAVVRGHASDAAAAAAEVIGFEAVEGDTQQPAAPLAEGHARYVESLARAAARGLVGAQQASWLDRLDGERGNIELALEWFVAQRLVDRGLRTVAALWPWWWARDRVADGLGWIRRLLAHAEHVERDSGAVRGLCAAAWLATFDGDSASALEFAQRALRLYQSDPSQPASWLVWLLVTLSAAAVQQGQRDLAEELSANAQTRARASGDDRSAAVATLVQARVGFARGDLARARLLAEESLGALRGQNDLCGTASALLLLGQIAACDHANAAADVLLRESLEAWQLAGHHWGARVVLAELARHAAEEGDYDTARLRLQERQRLSGAPRGQFELLLQVGDAARRAADFDEAVAFCETAEALLSAAGPLQDRPQRARLLLTRGLTELGRGKQAAALGVLGQALAIARAQADWPLVGDCLAGLASLDDQHERAARLFGAAQSFGSSRASLDESIRRSAFAPLLAQAQHGEGALAASWAAAGSVPPDQIVAEGLRLATAPVPDVAPTPLTLPSAQRPAGLTGREWAVLQLMAAGRTNKEIAAQLVVSVHTVERHSANIYAKLGVHGRAAAVYTFSAMGGALAASATA